MAYVAQLEQHPDGLRTIATITDDETGQKWRKVSDRNTHNIAVTFLPPSMGRWCELGGHASVVHSTTTPNLMHRWWMTRTSQFGPTTYVWWFTWNYDEHRYDMHRVRRG